MTHVHILTYNNGPISVHRTPEGAKATRKLHKRAKQLEWERWYEEKKPSSEFNEVHKWNIEKMKLQP